MFSNRIGLKLYAERDIDVWSLTAIVLNNNSDESEHE